MDIIRTKQEINLVWNNILGELKNNPHDWYYSTHGNTHYIDFWFRDTRLAYNQNTDILLITTHKGNKIRFIAEENLIQSIEVTS